jgi:polysaccharide export outer membrane protein
MTISTREGGGMKILTAWFYKGGIAFMVLLAHAGCNIPDDAIYVSDLASDAEEVTTLPADDEGSRKELEELQKVKIQDYQIAPGDKFDFRVYDNEDMAFNGLIVTPDGNVSIPLAGVVRLGGFTIADAQKKIEENLSQYIREPHVALIPIEISSSTFTIIGKVGLPNRFPITRNTRLTDAIAMAKGFLTGQYDGKTIEIADLDHAFVARDGKILPVDFIEAITKGNPLHNIPLKDGDYIYIPSSVNEEIFILGEVETPNHVGYQKGLTVSRALTYAKGLKESASSKVLVIRGNLRKPKVYVVDIHDVMRGMQSDFALKPNDIVFAPRGAFSQYNVVVEKLMPTFELLNLMAGPFGNAMMTLPGGAKGGGADSGKEQETSSEGE